MREAELISVFHESKDMPSVNKEITEIIRMLNNSDTLNIDLLAEKIARCGNLRSALLTNINSGYFNLARSIESLSDAIVYLGMKTVEKLIIAYLIKSLLPDALGKSKELSREKYWKHCLGTSIAANMLAEKLGKEDKYKYFAYGLIHDVGVAALDVCMPAVVDEVVKLQQKGLHQVVAERLVMKGFTHSNIGAWLCLKWELPEDIKAIVEHHHTPLLTKDYYEEVRIMSVADSISSLYYERLLSLNTTYVLNEKIMELLGVTMEDIESISELLPDKVQEAEKQFNFTMVEI
jgi:HD-like signal output (HDOD) protein